MAIPNPGFYGKLPMTGDFIHRRVNPQFLNRWDEWLKHNMAQSQQLLGDRWLEVYLTSPIWRFCVSPGIIDEYGYCGVMVPSVDSVGRYFPLTIVQPLPPKALPHILADCASVWFQQAEDLLLDMLEGYHTNIDSFDSALTALKADWVSGLPPVGAVSIDDLKDRSLHAQMTISDHSSFAQATSALLFSSYLNQRAPYSFWWQQSAEQAQNSCLLAAGLPAGNQFCGLLDGSWSEHKWRTLDFRVAAPPQQKNPVKEPAANAGVEQPKPLQAQPGPQATNQSTPLETASISNLISDITAPQANLINTRSMTAEVTAVDSGSGLVQLIEDDDEDVTISPVIPLHENKEKVAAVTRIVPESYGFTDPGNCREYNEDSMLIKPSSGLFAVADGMGGHTDGAYASQQVVNALSGVEMSGSFEQVIERVRLSLDTANRDLLIHAEEQAENNICGSTVAGLFIRDNQCAIFWAGDSRIYLLRDNSLFPLSKDHSFEQEQIDAGLLPNGSVDFPGKNFITRAVGGDERLVLDVMYHKLLPGDGFFLCSDGVYNEISEEDLENALVSNPSVDEAGKAIHAHIANSAAKDNFTGVIVYT